MKALIVPLIAVLGRGACATNRLSDTDRLMWSPVSTCTDIAADYSPESDTSVYFTKNASTIDIPRGHLCILFPEDAHASAPPAEGNPKKILLKLSLAGQPS